MSIRQHRNLSFYDIQDGSGSIQLAIRRDSLPPNTDSKSLAYENLNLLDIGDFVEASGIVGKTKTSEITIFVNRIRLLTKSLRPLPEKWSGIKDRELMLRRRYLDTTMNPEKRIPFESIGRMLYAIRTFLNEQGFVEVLTPIIQPQYGGGLAKPFRTYVNALNSEMFLSISHELYLKRLIAGGFEKVYTIGRYFRNEGIDRTHQPEFSMLETMTAFENYEYNMDLIESLFKSVAKSAFQKSIFRVRGHQIDISQPWKRLSMVEAIKTVTGVDFRNIGTLDEANKVLLEQEINEPQTTVGRALLSLFETKVQPTLIEPTLIFGHPANVSPLAKPMENDPRFAERFELFIAGTELSENWTEQNDPQQLLSTWQELQAFRDEYQPIDYDFIEVLDYGMPPTTGLGPGIERMAMLFTENENIDDVVFFPILRPTLSRENKAIFKIEDLNAQNIEKHDITIHIDEFYPLLEEGLVKPAEDAVKVQPYIYHWKKTNKIWKTTGSLVVSGLLDSAILRISGYVSRTDFSVDSDTSIRWFEDSINASFVEPLLSAYPQCNVNIAKIISSGYS